METKQHKTEVKKSRRIPYDEAKIIVRDFKSRVRFCFGTKCIRLKIIPVGSFRRKKSTLKDVDFIIIYPKRYSQYKDNIIYSMKLTDSKSAQIKSLNS
jgi:DNA polymerase/3'-5' exonuclease PolX